MEINENLELFIEEQTTSMINFSQQKSTILQTLSQAQDLHTKLANKTETISLLQTEFHDKTDYTDILDTYKQNLDKILSILNQKINNSKAELEENLAKNKETNTIDLSQF